MGFQVYENETLVRTNSIDSQEFPVHAETHESLIQNLISRKNSSLQSDIEKETKLRWSRVSPSEDQKHRRHSYHTQRSNSVPNLSRSRINDEDTNEKNKFRDKGRIAESRHKCNHININAASSDTAHFTHGRDNLTKLLCKSQPTSCINCESSLEVKLTEQEVKKIRRRSRRHSLQDHHTSRTKSAHKSPRVSTKQQYLDNKSSNADESALTSKQKVINKDPTISNTESKHNVTSQVMSNFANALCKSKSSSFIFREMSSKDNAPVNGLNKNVRSRRGSSSFLKHGASISDVISDIYQDQMSKLRFEVLDPEYVEDIDSKTSSVKIKKSKKEQNKYKANFKHAVPVSSIYLDNESVSSLESIVI